jgi:hypothetical protein
MKYKILSESEPLVLEDEVNRLLSDGWRPCGGVSVVRDTEFAPPIFSQAMIFEDNAPE